MFKKLMLTLMIAVLALGALPAQAQAAALRQGDAPPADPARLEQTWARLTRIYNRLGQTDEFTVRVQERLDQAANNGLDVSAAQDALQAFIQAAEEAAPLYQQAGEIVAAHDGFDADGKVTDEAQAAASVQALGEALQQIRTATASQAQALRQALGELKQQSKAARLERTWERWQNIVARTAERAAGEEEFIARVQETIDRAAADGQDVAAAQAALEAFQAAAAQSRPLLEEAQALVEEHAGFTADGQISDPEQATATVQAVGDLLRQIRQLMAPAGKDLRQALRDLRPAKDQPSIQPAPGPQP